MKVEREFERIKTDIKMLIVKYMDKIEKEFEKKVREFARTREELKRKSLFFREKRGLSTDEVIDIIMNSSTIWIEKKTWNNGEKEAYYLRALTNEGRRSLFLPEELLQLAQELVELKKELKEVKGKIGPILECINTLEFMLEELERG